MRDGEPFSLRFQRANIRVDVDRRIEPFTIWMTLLVCLQNKCHPEGQFLIELGRDPWDLACSILWNGMRAMMEARFLMSYDSFRNDLAIMPDTYW